MVDHLKPEAEGGGRACIIMNGLPLFTGDAGSGESNIRRWLLEEDYVEAIIALPEQLFYNTGIATYVWVVTNAKAPERAGKVQLIDAFGEAFWTPMRKSLGDKRRRISDDQIDTIFRLFQAFDEEASITYTTEEGKRRPSSRSRSTRPSTSATGRSASNVPFASTSSPVRSASSGCGTRRTLRSWPNPTRTIRMLGQKPSRRGSGFSGKLSRC